MTSPVDHDDHLSPFITPSLFTPCSITYDFTTNPTYHRLLVLRRISHSHIHRFCVIFSSVLALYIKQ